MRSDDFIGQRVINVELVSEGRRLDDQSVIELVETTLGMPLSMRQVRESLTHLFSLGRFQSVRVDVRQLKGGVGLRFELLPLQIIERISFHGELGFSTDDLRRAVTEGHGAFVQSGRSASRVKNVASLVSGTRVSVRDGAY